MVELDGLRFRFCTLADQIFGMKRNTLQSIATGKYWITSNAQAAYMTPLQSNAVEYAKQIVRAAIEMKMNMLTSLVLLKFFFLIVRVKKARIPTKNTMDVMYT